jgi:hypothetical protein
MKRSILLLAIISLSMVGTSFSKKNSSKFDATYHISTTSNDLVSTAALDLHEQQSLPWTILFIPTDSDAHFKVILGDEDWKTYFFQFDRIKRARRFCELWCILARMIVIISHVSALLFAFKSFVVI